MVKSVLKVVIIITTFILTITFSLAGSKVKAEELFSIKPVLTDTQVPGIENYVYIKTNGKPVSDVFQYEIKNRTDKDMTIEVTPLNAVISPRGSIQYIETIDNSGSKVIDENYLFARYTNGKQLITVGPNETELVSIGVNIPVLDGQILGAFGFKTIGESQKVENEGISLQIQNELNTVLAFQVDFNDNITGTLEVGEPFIETFPTYFAIRLPITSNINSVLENVEFDYEVIDKSGNKLFSSKDNKYLSFAPKSTFNYTIPWNYDTIRVDEKYVLKGIIYVKTVNGLIEFPINEEVQFDKTGIVKGGVSLDRITTKVDYSGNWSKYFIIGIIFILIVTVSVVTFFAFKIRKENLEMKRLMLENEETTATTEIEDDFTDETEEHIGEEYNNELTGRDTFILNVKEYKRLENHKLILDVNKDSLKEILLTKGIYVLPSSNKDFLVTLDLEENYDNLYSLDYYEFTGSENERFIAIYKQEINEKKLKLQGVCVMSL